MSCRSLLLAAVLLAFGCDAIGEAPPTHCEEAGARCVLSKGPIGICERTACAEPDAEPCFVCTPQH